MAAHTWLSVSALRMVAVAIFSMAIHAPSFAQSVLYVDASSKTAGDGLTWDTAMNDLQIALAAAAQSNARITEIRVADGLYLPRVRTDPNDPRSATFQMLANLTVKGGFAGAGAAVPDAWDPEVFVSTLSGDLAGDDAGGLPGAENVYHIMRCEFAEQATATVVGLRFAGGNANIPNNETWTHRGGGIFCIDSTLVVQHCKFENNFARSGASVYARKCRVAASHCGFLRNHALAGGTGLTIVDGTESTIDECTFRENVGESSGPVNIVRGSANVSNCLFADNDADMGSGTVHYSSEGAPAWGMISNCVFERNVAGVGGGIHAEANMTIEGCIFRNNLATVAAGGVLVSHGCRVDRCVFEGNSCSWFGGGAIVALYGNTVANTVISNGVSNPGGGGGIFTTGDLTLINCTIANNQGDGIVFADDGALNASNCIFWGNEPQQIVFVTNPPPPPGPLDGVVRTLNSCIIQGGWTGAGNGNSSADPRFTQPGCQNLRLRTDSPALNAGDASTLPPWVMFDLDAEPRVQGVAVDIGAYEGGEQPLPVIACLPLIIQGVPNFMVPTGGSFEPFHRAGARVGLPAPQPAPSATLEQTTANIHLGCGGYSEIGDILRYVISVPDGAHRSTVCIPFTAAQLGQLSYANVDLTAYDQRLGKWVPAAALDITINPNTGAPLGERIVVVGTDAEYGMSNWIGDYGVFWNPEQGRGFAWARIDHAGELAIGAALPPCPTDCAVPHDGITNREDILAVLMRWGFALAGEPADINADFVVDVADLLRVIVDWGPCS